jgi:hypothetical protein
MASCCWKMVNAPEFHALWERQSPGVEPPRVYQNATCLTAIVGREPYGHDDMRWHISVRFGDPGVDGRIPTWEECVSTAHELRPGVCFVIGIPPRSWWMNVHPHVLHLHETRDRPLIEEFRNNALASVPS